MIRLSLLVLLTLFGCGEASRKDLLPRNSGAKGEYIVVAPSQVWTTSYADAVASSLGKTMYGLPQEELLLQRVEVKESGFDDFFKKHRNILKIEVLPSKPSGVTVKHDVYARQQVFITIRLQSLNELSEVLASRSEDILAIFHQAEVDRLIDRNKSVGNEALNDQIRDLTGLNIVMQDKFQIAVNEPGFLWLRLDQSKPLGGYQHTISQGIMIYMRPYTDTADFSDSSLYAWKNNMNQKYIDGPQNSYMNISERFILPRSKRILFQEQTAKEIRGLWRMEGYFMGGPFYALVFYNQENGKQYMVEGYAYAPQFEKAPLMREIEAIAKSVSPIKKDQGS